MFDIMAPTFFYLNRSIPKKFQQMINEATGSQIDSFMIRAYLQEGYSQPKSSAKAEFEGAISMGLPGIYKNVRKIDVTSLYPSIMRQYKIYPKDKDPNQVFLKSLEYFTEERIKNKKLAKETGDKYYDDLQNSQKILINSMYGFMGASYLLYNYPKGAASVTRYGREILQKAVEWACGFRLEHKIKRTKNEGKENEEDLYEWLPGEKFKAGKGYTLVNVDTDSISYTSGTKPDKLEFKKEIEEVNSLYPDLIKWEDDGIYDKIIVVKAKNYILKQEDKIKLKGSSLIDQKKEPALRELLSEVINIILKDSYTEDELISIYNKYCREAFNIQKIERWASKKTITKSVLNPERKNEQKVYDAIIGKNYQEGDKVWLYTTEDDRLELIENFKNNADKWHYVKRVYNTLSILSNIINIDMFPKYYNKKSRQLLENLVD
jgi:DNA polymerase, archaea type